MNRTFYTPRRFESFRDLIYHSAEKFGNKTAFLLKEKGQYIKISYNKVKEDYKKLCGIMAGLGLAGEKIAVSGKNSYAWVLHYLAAATVGVVVPLDRQLQARDVANLIESANCKALFSDKKLHDSMQTLYPSLTLYKRLDDTHSEADIVPDFADKAIIPPDEMRVLIFTSGTTGSSKGVCLSQKNICTNIYQTLQIVRVTENDTTLSILPLHHTYECTLNCLLMLSVGACITYAEGLTRIKANILEYQPTFIVVVPALMKALDKRLSGGIADGCPKAYRSLFKENPLHIAMQKTPFWLRYAVRKKVKKQLGGRLKTCIVGAAALDSEIIFDFQALGIRALQGYGLTECAPLLAGNNDFYFNAASTGVAIPGVELMIDNPNENGEGEILAKGENIMLGYYNDDEATRKAFKNGYFRTGDLGVMDADGALYIKGRLKNVIVTTNGKNIYPEELEARLAENEGILESLVLAADNSKGEICVKAKIVPNISYIKEQLGHIPTTEELKNYVKSIVAALNKTLPSYKCIRLIDVMEHALEKTTTQKIKRYGVNNS